MGMTISLELMAKTVSPEDQSITFPMLHLAVTLYHLNRDEEAEQLALKIVYYLDKLGRKDEKFSIQKRLSVLMDVTFIS
uniref:Uncharacterized protein n=1 Tax=Manihot esculenta TaxID=3983 RepID=A0A2C9VLV0_MANES